MPKTIAVLGSALFFAVAPSSVAGLVPWWITHWEFRPPFFDLEATRAVGILLIVAGLPGLVGQDLQLQQAAIVGVMPRQSAGQRFPAKS